MKPLRTTYKSPSGQITLCFGNSDLMLLISDKSTAGFTKAIGMYENHRVATGMDTDAWVERGRGQLIETVQEYGSAMDFSGTAWEGYFPGLSRFLESQTADSISIRHHYAWWYPKAFDTLLAAWH